MKKAFRGVFLVIILIMVVANLGASSWPSEYGTCYVTCYNDGQQVQVVQSGITSNECCAQVSYVCPDNNYPASVGWWPYEGWPVDCPP